LLVNLFNGIGFRGYVSKTDAIEEIYQQYLSTYRKGAFNFIQEEKDQNTGRNMPRKYFSGGLQWDKVPLQSATISEAMTVANGHLEKSIQVKLNGAVSRRDIIIAAVTLLASRLSPLLQAAPAADLDKVDGYLKAIKEGGEERHDSLEKLLTALSLPYDVKATVALNKHEQREQTDKRIQDIADVNKMAGAVIDKKGIDILIASLRSLSGRDLSDDEIFDLGYLIGVIGQLVMRKNDRITLAQKTSISDLIYPYLWVKDQRRTFLKNASSMTLAKLIKYNRGTLFAKTLEASIWNQRQRIALLPTTRVSKNIVLIVRDSFFHFDKGVQIHPHGFQVLGILLTTIFQKTINLENEQIYKKVQASLEDGKDITAAVLESLEGIYHLNLKDKGIDLDILNWSPLQNPPPDFSKFLGRHTNRTIVFNGSFSGAGIIDLGEESITSYTSLINGTFDPTLVKRMAVEQGNELVMSFVAGNGNMPRVYTHDVYDNVFFVGATLAGGPNLKLAWYSNYGSDVQFSIPALTLGRPVSPTFGTISTLPETYLGTSFSAPVLSGLIVAGLLRDTNRSARDVMRDISQTNKGNVPGGGVLLRPWQANKPHKFSQATDYKGGIDFNPEGFKLEFSSNIAQPDGLNPKQWPDVVVSGLTPVIMNVKDVNLKAFLNY
jgi:hypothetical protein